MTRRFIFDPDVNLAEARVAVIGLGLMGGSLGLALRQRSLCREVVGLVRRAETGRQAEALGAVDWATTEPEAVLPEANLVIFATPVRSLLAQLTDYVNLYRPGAIITDLGSTKQEIVRVMDRLPHHLRPIGSHPMCGKEQPGLDAADANLYVGAPWILTPSPRTDPAATQLVGELAEAIGCRLRVLDAARHDWLIATVSHLPYALATTLMATALQVAAADETVWDVAATGFRDTSRVAAGSVEMWLDILLTNRVAVGEVIDLARQQLDQLAAALATGDEATLHGIISRTAGQRRRIY